MKIYPKTVFFFGEEMQFPSKKSYDFCLFINNLRPRILKYIEYKHETYEDSKPVAKHIKNTKWPRA